MGRTVSKLDSMILCCSGKGSSDRRRVRIRVRSILNSKSPEKSDGESWWKSCKGSEAENCKRESLDKRWCKADSYRIVEITAQIKGEFRSLGCSSARFQWGEKLFFGRERRDRKQNTIVPSRMMVFHNTQVKVSQSRANSLFLCYGVVSQGCHIGENCLSEILLVTSKIPSKPWLFQQRPRIMPNFLILKEI